ncbi:MAG: hypothetical protein QME92_13385, partial [Bacillota bacterium]|nr:hypothetical protein [Bacillota bacterium]
MSTAAAGARRDRQRDHAWRDEFAPLLLTVLGLPVLAKYGTISLRYFSRRCGVAGVALGDGAP